MTSARLAQRVLTAALALVGIAPAAFASGRLEGRVTRPDGTGLAGVTVLLNETGASTLTDSAGSFVFDRLAAGTFTVTFALGDKLLTVPGVRVADTVVRLDRTLDWTGHYADTITVYAASRRTERLFEAPASAAVVSEGEIRREAAREQLPAVLQSVPAVDVAQSGMFDFNVNIRGLNVTLNRRVLTLLDGRDSAAVLAGSQEWAAMGLPLDEVGRVEVVLGPASALYGANAFNGVIDITSKEPRYSPGGSLQFTLGDNATRRVSVRHAAPFGGGWFYRVHAMYGRTGDFFTARTHSVEYPGLPAEVIPPVADRTEFISSGGRVDRYFSSSSLFTIEGGWSRNDGNVVLTGAGRPQNRGVQRPWVRAEFRHPRWRAFGYYDGRRGEMLSLATGGIIADDSTKLHGEVQRRFVYARGRGSIVAGGAIRYERADSRNDAGQPTIFRDVVDARTTAAYGQIDQALTKSLRAILAARFDESTLHSRQLSPKAGLVYSLAPGQHVRLTFGHAFQTGSFLQYYTRTPAAPPVQLGAVEAALRPALGGVALGLDSVPILVLGNDRLEVERISSVETGYSGVFRGRLLVRADYYFNRVNDLITSLLPQVGTSLGRINPQFAAYEPPASLSAAQRELVLATLRSVLPASLFQVLSNDLDGTPVFAAVSLTNFARVNLQGATLHARYFASDRLSADAGLSWLHLGTKSEFPEEPLSPNAPRVSLRAGVTYADRRKSAGLRYRWSDGFTWIGGIFRGPVPAYGVADLSASYELRPQWRLQANVTNVLDNKHYEIFGGDILRRSALVTLAYDW